LENQRITVGGSSYSSEWDLEWTKVLRLMIVATIRDKVRCKRTSGTTHFTSNPKIFFSSAHKASLISPLFGYFFDVQLQARPGRGPTCSGEPGLAYKRYVDQATRDWKTAQLPGTVVLSSNEYVDRDKALGLARASRRSLLATSQWSWNTGSYVPRMGAVRSGKWDALVWLLSHFGRLTCCHYESFELDPD
jgi:hypothetical protein